MSDFSMSRDEVREVDRRAIEELGLPGIVLMENAGRGCVDWLLELGVRGPVVICAGRGNNGGDGFVMARHLENHGVDVRVLLFSDPQSLRGDAAINWKVLERSGTPLSCVSDPASGGEWKTCLESADWIVDALLGTGTRGALREPFPDIIACINDAPGRVFSVDLPSGLDCDRGEPVDTERPVCVSARVTATLVARKRGFENPRAAEFTGDIRVIDIGVPRTVIESESKPVSRAGE